MPRALKWWIKERDNPQLGIYYSACGQLTKAAAKRHEDTLYGSNTMLSFDTEQSYNEAMRNLRAEGKKVV